MNKFKKTLLILGLLIFITILFRGWIFRFTINYSIVGNRNCIELKDKDLIRELSVFQKNTIEEIIDIAKNQTNRRLKFSKKTSSNNPNNLIKNGKANCVGYASLFCSIGNHLIKTKNLDNKFRFNHLIGELDFLGINLHQFTTNSFFKDHDFNEIENLKTGEKTYIDLSISDYLKIDAVSVNQ